MLKLEERGAFKKTPALKPILDYVSLRPPFSEIEETFIPALIPNFGPTCEKAKVPASNPSPKNSFFINQILLPEKLQTKCQKINPYFWK